MLTSSNFGQVCRSIKKDGHVKSIAYPKNLGSIAAIEHGRFHEEVAKLQLEDQINEKIFNCGIFIDNEFNFLAASPDGIINKDTVVEIKCPYSIAGIEKLIILEKYLLRP